MTESLGDQSLQRLLETVAARTSAPGGGAVTGVVAALAGALVEMCARFSGTVLTEGTDLTRRTNVTDLAGRADELRTRAVSLAQSDLVVYVEYMRARRAGDDGDLAAALDEAIRIPLEMADVAVELAQIALGLARSGNPNLRGDATAAVLMGVAAAKAAAVLAVENLSGTEGDPTLVEPKFVDPRLARAAAIVVSATTTELDALSPYPVLRAT
ncbi:MAG: cyclodeaminase/cyclohydrolase family protein [Actinomycetota bacterium]